MTTTGMCCISPLLGSPSHTGAVALSSYLVRRRSCFVAPLIYNLLCSPICEQKVLDSKINKHLDSDCSSTNTTTHKAPFADNTSSSNTSKGPLTRDDTRTPANNTKLAPIFSLGKRGPETRPSLQDDVETLVASSSSQSQPIDVDEEPSPPSKRARRIGGEPGANKRGLIQMTSIFAPKRPPIAPPGGYLRAAAPLAEQLRPRDLEDFVGQGHLTGPHSVFSSLIESGNIGSMILWGPPGCVCVSSGYPPACAHIS